MKYTVSKEADKKVEEDSKKKDNNKNGLVKGEEKEAEKGGKKNKISPKL